MSYYPPMPVRAFRDYFAPAIKETPLEYRDGDQRHEPEHAIRYDDDPMERCDFEGDDDGE